MIKILLVLLIVIFSNLTVNTPVLAQELPQLDAISIEPKKLDERAVILKNYLAKYNSPLQYHTQDFIDAADTYQVDWKLVPAISGVESTFGKFIPGGYNGWGWGVYGTNVIYFKSWRDGIFTVTKGLKENYINRGLTDPYAMNRIYAASPTWGSKVTYFYNDIEKFAKDYQDELKKPADMAGIDNNTAGNSAQLNLDLSKLAFKP